MTVNIEKTVSIAFTTYVSYNIIRYFINGDINIKVTRDAMALIGAACVMYSWCPFYNK